MNSKNIALLFAITSFLIGPLVSGDYKKEESAIYNCECPKPNTSVPNINIVYVDYANGTDDTWCLQAGEHCRTLSYALSHTHNNVTIEVVSSEISLHTNIVICDRSNVSIVGRGVSNTLIQCGWWTDASNETYAAGLSIIRVEHFTMKNLTMRNCGALCKPNRTGKVFRSAIATYNSSYITIDNVSINSSNGMGMAMLNTNHSMKVMNSIFYNNSADKRCQHLGNNEACGGGGIRLIIFYRLANNSKFIIQNCKFIQNRKYTLHKLHSRNFNHVYLGLGNGGGLQFILYKVKLRTMLLIRDSTFSNNSASWGGGMYLGIKHANHSSIQVFNSIFESNEASSEGGGGMDIGFYTNRKYRYVLPMHNNITFQNCTVHNNAALYGGGTSIFTSIDLQQMYLYNYLIFHNCSWIGNVANFSSAIDVSPDTWDSMPGWFSLTPRFSNCSFISNFMQKSKNTDCTKKGNINRFNFYFNSGIFWATSIDVEFQGRTEFSNNGATALQLTSASAKFLDGSKVWFHNNTGSKGGAVALIGMSYFQFNRYSTFTFVNNTAQYVGGAIYAISIDPHDYIQTRTCFLSGRGTGQGDKSVDFHFSGNRALGNLGHSIFATTLNSCIHHCRPGLSCFPSNSTNKMDQAVASLNCCIANFVFDSSTSTSEATLATLGVKYNDTINQMIHSFPGKYLHLHLTILDELDNNVTSSTVLRADFTSNETSQLQSSQFTVTGAIKVLGRPGQLVNVALKISDLQEISTSFNVILDHCPPGFTYDNEDRACVCITWKYEGFQSCRTDLFQSWILQGFWIGYLSEEVSPSTLVTSICPIGFCNYQCRTGSRYHNTCRSRRSSLRVLLPNVTSCEQLSEFVCSEGRSGILCGACSNSVYYHSSSKKCVEDSGSCKFGILFFILSDLMPVTIVFFIVLFFNISFTSGAMNGFILFAQVVDLMNTNANGLILFPKAKYLILASELIYGFFNLYISNDEISYCIWKGAGTLDVLVIRYVAIVYALLLVLLLVFIMNHCGCYHICRCIHRQSFKSSIIQGLSAFLVMCYAQCARVTFMILQPGFLKGKGHKIMYDKVVVHFSGNIEYFGSKHQPYALIAVVFLITFVLLPPIILLTNSILIQILSYCHCKNTRVVNVVLMTRFKPLLDSFQGCFKDSCRCFAGIYFFYRISFLLLHATFPVALAFYILTEVFLIILIGVHAIVQPYQQKWHNTLDILLFINLALINGITIYVYTGSITDGSRIVVEFGQWLQLLLIYLPIAYIAGRVIVIAVRKLRSSYQCKWGDDGDSVIYDSLPARLLSDQFNSYESIN